MKRETREWLNRVVCDAAAPQDFEANDAADILDSDARQRAEIRDLKARLAAVQRIGGVGDGGERTRSKAFGKALRRITDPKNKNWRKP